VADLPDAMKKKLAELEVRYKELDQEISAPDLFDDPDKARVKLKEHGRLKPMLDGWTNYQKVAGQLADAQEMLEDEEMRELAEAEVPQLTEELDQISEQLKDLFVTGDAEAASDIVVEINAGVGGDEAALFAADLFRMYTRYAEREGWKVDVLDSGEGKMGGFKHVAFTIEGNNVFGRLRFESGGHRVQRVPSTESQGRIHTSMATVVVLPQVEEVDVEIPKSDVRVDTYSASGPGGQHVNKTQSAVRLTHEPTGIVVQCQDEKSQIKNMARAWKVLRARVADHFKEIAEKERGAQRQSLRGRGLRNERIRTYNFPQDRCTDHRVGHSAHGLDQILDGDLDGVIQALIDHDKEEALKSL
jgi:peptide chain release factor 1